MKRIFAAAMVASAATAAHAAQPEVTVEELRACLSRTVPEHTVVQYLRMITTSAHDGVEEALDARLFLAGRSEDRGLRAMLRVDTPEHLAGASYLVMEDVSERRNDSMYVFLPTVRRVRRVEGGFADTALMGTQFSYNEFRYWLGLIDEARTTLLPSEARDGRTFHRIRVEPPVPERSPYGHMDADIDAESCLIVKADFVVRDIVLKEMRVSLESLQRAGNYWYPSEVRVRDPRRELETVMRVERIEMHESVESKVFSPEEFYRVP